MKFTKLVRGITALAMFAVMFAGVASPVGATELGDGTWDRAASVDSIDITLSTALVAGDYIYLTFNYGTDNVAGAVADATVDTVASTVVVTDNVARITVPAAGATGATAIVGTFLTAFDATAGQHSVAVSTTEDDGTNVDFGVAVTVTDLNDNTVDVSASVPQFINLALSKTTINLGVLSISSVKTDSHTLTVNTNDENGYMVKIDADGQLNDAASNDINPVIEGTTVAADGVEEYGIAVTVGGSASALGDFTDDDTPIPVTVADFISYTDTASADVHTVQYRAAIDGNTVAGDYDQVVTYTIASL